MLAIVVKYFPFPTNASSHITVLSKLHNAVLIRTKGMVFRNVFPYFCIPFNIRFASFGDLFGS
jgi:hypothetical protein